MSTCAMPEDEVYNTNVDAHTGDPAIKTSIHVCTLQVLQNLSQSLRSCMTLDQTMDNIAKHHNVQPGSQ